MTHILKLTSKVHTFYPHGRFTPNKYAFNILVYVYWIQRNVMNAGDAVCRHVRRMFVNTVYSYSNNTAAWLFQFVDACLNNTKFCFKREHCVRLNCSAFHEQARRYYERKSIKEMNSNWREKKIENEIICLLNWCLHFILGLHSKARPQKADSK